MVSPLLGLVLLAQVFAFTVRFSASSVVKEFLINFKRISVCAWDIDGCMNPVL